MFAIYKRELRAYFTTAVGYVFLAIIVALSAVAFSLTTILQATNDVTTYFTVLLFILMVALPVLTMKLFSEERKMRTEQLLLTAPVPIAKIVAAKFFAAFTVFFGANLLCSLAYITLFVYSDPEGGIILGNIIGNPIVPVLKLTANPKTVRTMSEHIDLDVTGILRREMTIPQAGDALIDMVLRTCNGRITAAEALRHREFVMTKLYPSA